MTNTVAAHHERSGPGWPNHRQELLLVASTAPPERAVPAFEEWIAGTDLVRDPVDPGSLRLLPLVYRKLSAAGFEHPAMARLKGVYRYWWLKNQGTLRRAAEVVELLGRRGLDTLVLKGVALSVLCYRDAGVRPMADFDVMVPWDRAEEAVGILTEEGWNELGTHHPGRFRFLHGLGLTDGRGFECDLHWHFIRELRGTGPGDPAWRDTVDLEIHGVPTLALDATGALFHTIVHGCQWNAMPSIRWVADALTVLAASGAGIDWPRLIGLANELRLNLRFGAGLRYLHDSFDAPIPRGVLKELEASPPSAVENLEARYLWLDREQREEMALARAPFLLISVLRLLGALGLRRGLAALPDFLVFQFGLGGRRELPLTLARLSLRKLWRLAGPATETG